jgi:hypothetical protein
MEQIKMIKDKIIWRKPDYKNEYSRVSDKDIDKHCIDRTESGDIKIEREQYGRKITFKVYRIEKIGELVEGIDTLSRQRAIEELKKGWKNDFTN